MILFTWLSLQVWLIKRIQANYFNQEQLIRSVSGVIGEAEQFDGTRLPVVVVFSLLVVAGVGQQRALRVPGNSESRRVTLNLPQLLSYTYSTLEKQCQMILKQNRTRGVKKLENIHI